MPRYSSSSFRVYFLYAVILLQALALSYVLFVRQPHHDSSTNSSTNNSDNINIVGSGSSSVVSTKRDASGVAPMPSLSTLCANGVKADDVSSWESLLFCREFHGFDIMVASMYSNRPVKAKDVTWTMQFTVDRLAVFALLLERWDGPVTAVIHTTMLENDLSAVYQYSNRVDFHFVMGGQGLYPVNVLRNCAMDKVRSDFFIIVDVDFLPNVGVHDLMLKNLDDWDKDHNNVYILPAFQVEKGSHQSADVIPTSKADLVAQYREGKITQVHPDPGRKIAHDRCDYDRWLTATSPYEVEYGFPFEPYFVAHKTIPRFDPRFIGYGNDKAVHCYEMHAANVTFMVWPEGYVVHKDHDAGAWFYKTFQTFDSRMKKAMEGFWVDMARRYPRQPYVPPTPSDEVHPIAGNRGTDCHETCNIRGLQCDEASERFVNHCEVMERTFFCMGGCSSNLVGADIPAFDTTTDTCITTINRDAFAFQCKARHPNTARLCPCKGKLLQRK